MWIRNLLFRWKVKRLLKSQSEYERGLAVGYKLGWEAGQVEVCNRMMSKSLPKFQNKEPSIGLITEIEDIMKRKESE